jgi:hypothetical protein
MSWNVNDADLETLAQCEALIGRRSFLDEARAFQQIRDKRLYQAEYASFNDYCKRRWGYRRQYVDYQIRALAVCRDLTTIVVNNTPDYPLPLNEGQCRRLAPLTTEQRVDVWQKAVAAAGGLQPSDTEIARLVAEVKREENIGALADLHEEVSPDGLFEVRCCRFQDADVRDESIDVILTDPPYGEAWIETYGQLSRWGERVLKPGGMALVMIGQDHLDAALAALTTGLRFHWMLAYVLQPGSPYGSVPGRQVVNGWKPIVWLTKGKPQIPLVNRDVFVTAANRATKKLHPWQQALDVFGWLVERFTDPLHVICDPFLGAGTSGVAARMYGRRFLGIDCDPEACRIAGQRIAATDPPEFPEKLSAAHRRRWANHRATNRPASYDTGRSGYGQGKGQCG